MTTPTSVAPRWLSKIRFRPTGKPGGETLADAALSDRGRVLFCASFRRLNQKTQVFALDPNDDVRSRLTHSLEVAQLGSLIVDEVYRLMEAPSEGAPPSLWNEWCRLDFEQRAAIRSFVEVACLVHDIGNPPFGHFAEKAICSWFDKRRKLKQQLGATQKHLLDDFVKFDGNKQGFRILTCLQRNMDDEYGLNLTYSQLAATIKYPLDTQNGKGSIFESERHLKNSIWGELDLKSGDRYTFAYLMDAADDIAYGLSDIEDGFEKRIVFEKDLSGGIFNPRDPGQGINAWFTKQRVRISRFLCKEAAAKFVELLKGKSVDEDEGLLCDSQLAKDLREFASRIYLSKIVLEKELTAFKVITGMLDAFRPLLSMNEDDFRNLAIEFSKNQDESISCDSIKGITKGLTEHPALLRLFPRKHLSAYLSASKEAKFPELFHRAHLILDFIAGMTDDFALDTYRLLSGQRIYATT
jgi:dGTPase